MRGYIIQLAIISYRVLENDTSKDKTIRELQDQLLEKNIQVQILKEDLIRMNAMDFRKVREIQFNSDFTSKHHLTSKFQQEQTKIINELNDKLAQLNKRIQDHSSSGDHILSSSLAGSTIIQVTKLVERTIIRKASS